MSPEERKKLLGERVAMEDYLNSLQLPHVQRRVVEFLLSRKGYAKEDIAIDKEFGVAMEGASFAVRADIALHAGGVLFMIIKCVMNSLESWERHSLAFCRVVETCQIPYAAVTDSETARVLDILNGGTVSSGLDAIPAKDEALRIIEKTALCPYPQEKCEREKRILYAFDAIKCSTNLGGPEQ